MAMSSGWMLLLVVAGAAAAPAVWGEDQVELGEGSLLSSLDDYADLSLGEIQQAAAGVKSMSGSDEAEVRSRFRRLAMSLSSATLKESALSMAEMLGDAKMHHDLSESLGNQTDAEAENNRGGMKLVHKKLDDLRLRTINEGEEDAKSFAIDRENCGKTQAGASSMIETCSKTTAQNNAQMKNDGLEIVSIHRDSFGLEAAAENVHKEFVGIPPERESLIAQAMERIDERAKALEVLLKAIYIVCEKFKRFSKSSQCLRIKAMPDVSEPPLDQQRTNVTMKQDAQSTREFAKMEEDNFKSLQERDEEKVGDPNPENLPSDEPGADTIAPEEVLRSNPVQQQQQPQPQEEQPVQQAAQQSQKAESSKKQSPAERRLGESDEHSAVALSKSEMVSLQQVAKLAQQPQAERVSTPLIELVIAIKKGHRKKVINIVTLLVDVKQTILDEQLQDKRDHVQQLDELYEKSWQLQSVLSKQLAQQTSNSARTEECRVRVQSLMEDNENQRKMQNRQKSIKLGEEDRCNREAAAYGMRVATRSEDLANLAKLKSLLRSLYFKELPTACPSGPLIKQMCSGQDAGWCVFNKLTGQEQSCSCNYGAYGDMCEYRKCPGLGDIKYTGDASGACSDRGVCNHLSGKCETCNDGFYHGPKQACEFKKCPVSDYRRDEERAVEDQKCSGHGKCDTVRGICNCEYEWSGESCSSRKCPNSNSVLYPVESANACDGRGACNDQTAACSCEAPYSGTTCEKKACPRDCSKNGGCDEFTGKCFCKKPHSGASCALTSCPNDCNDGGWCDLRTGKCLCKLGFSGESCLRSTRCTNDQHSLQKANWYTQWDKPGWVACPEGQAVYGLFRSGCEALSCLDSGRCAAPCEGTGESATVIPLRHCYHATEIYTEFDVEGWAKCEPNYYVSGMYRSCDSLYCLNMFKCCNFKLKQTPTREVLCEEVSLASFDGRGWVDMPDHKFLSGLYRGCLLYTSPSPRDS
eukprot:TRINITY_DN2447_c0_g1_i6.p1 TRINITY_DN2447_c0_g1~~TRINITY_DN2447_c0_g1_i6.p1  ORF type:complete len:979 (-),score=250.00 TRINITY_DN2447_c0_g1_i6:101-3037(-)